MPTTMALFLLLLFLLHGAAGDSAADATALLALKSALDRSDRLPWRPATAATFCTSWPGVRQCGHGGRVTKLVLENLNLTGTLTAALLAPLAELRVLSLSSNALTGPVPDAFPPNLKHLYLADNRLQGTVPDTLALLNRAAVIVLSGNRLSGEIPNDLAALPRLTSLLLDRNALTGEVPPLGQPTLRKFNVSGNRLAGEIPPVLAARFNASSFADNAGLCGPPLSVPCKGSGVSSPSPAPQTGAATAAFAPLPAPQRSKSRRRAKVVAGATVGAAAALAIMVAAAALIMARRRGRSKRVAGDVDKGGGSGVPMADEEEPQPREQARHHDDVEATSSAVGGREFSWEREGGIGKLVFCGGAEMSYSLEELLRASAETLGRGEVGSTYKAVMETGYIVTVKRMREPSAGGDEFRRRAEELGGEVGRHPNVVAVRAYFQAKEERLLVYDYYPNGSLFSLIHGSRASSSKQGGGGGKPLHWTSCMKIAEDVAAGLLHLHQSGSNGVVHGNLKPSNVLLGPDFESCLTDYGLVPTLLPSSASHAHGHGDPSATSLLYRAPEARAAASCFSPASDVYSFGVLLLELLTGRAPFQDLRAGDIPGWVRAVRDEERESESASAGSSGGGAEEKLAALVGIAAACVAADPAARPATAEALRMVREARAEAMSSSNSSDRSPARWSDAVLAATPPPPTTATDNFFTDRE